MTSLFDRTSSSPFASRTLRIPRSFRPALTALLPAQVLAGFSVNASASALPADCAALGGTTGEDGVCTMTGTGIGAEGVNDDWTVEPGTTVVLTGGGTADAFAVNAAATDNGSFSLSLNFPRAIFRASPSPFGQKIQPAAH